MNYRILQMTTAICVLVFIFIVTGCAGSYQEVKQVIDSRRLVYVSTDKKFDESKIVYVKELRCYAYQPDEIIEDWKGTKKQKIVASLLYDAGGKKISNRDEAIERVKLAYTGLGYSTSEIVAGSVTAVWVIPVGIAFGVVENVAMLPALPYSFYIAEVKYRGESISFYKEGQQLFEQGKYTEARNKFFLSLHRNADLMYTSDVFFKIAQTYDKQGETILAQKYYRNFLEQSLSLFPEFFKLHKPDMVDNWEILDKEFSTAEDKIIINKPLMPAQQEQSLKDKVPGV